MIRRLIRGIIRWFKYYRHDDYVPLKKEWKTHVNDINR